MPRKLTLEEVRQSISHLSNDEYELLSDVYEGNRSKIKLRHKLCNHEYETNLFNFKEGGGRCPICSNNASRLTSEEFRKKYYLKFGEDNIEILGEYKGNKTKILCRCKKCNHQWYPVPNSLLVGHGCPNCNNIRRKEQHTMSHDMFLSKASISSPNTIVLSKYNGSHDRVSCKCKVCEHEWTPYAHCILNGQGCPKCGKEALRLSVLKDHNTFIEDFKTKSPYADNIEILGTYQNSKTKIKCRCKIHNYEFKTTPNKLLCKRICCPICTSKKVVKGINDLATLRPDLIKYFSNTSDAEKYMIGSKQRVKLRCPDCGYEKEMTVGMLANRGFSCNVCNDNGYSYPNRFAYSFLNQLPIENHIKEYSPDWIKPKRYDNYFEYQGKKYILEMDGGLHYKDAYHTTYNEVQENDRFKDMMAQKHNIEVIRIECLKSIPAYIKENILNSKLNKIFNLSDYDWDKCFKGCVGKSYYPIWEYANEHLDLPLSKIAKKFGKEFGQVRRIIEQGQQINICFYQIHESSKSISVYKDGIKLYDFSSISECVRELKRIYKIKITRDKIVGVCNNLYDEYKGFNFKFS